LITVDENDALLDVESCTVSLAGGQEIGCGAGPDIIILLPSTWSSRIARYRRSGMDYDIVPSNGLSSGNRIENVTTNRYCAQLIGTLSCSSAADEAEYLVPVPLEDGDEIRAEHARGSNK
jgi:hypothetical protein